jgi:hypothetical protein
MDHVVYLNHKAKELENLLNGTKTAIIRGATGRKIPHGRVEKGDVLYFIENVGDSLIKAKATVQEVFHSEKLTPEESIAIVDSHASQLKLDVALYKRFAGKRYLVLIHCTVIQSLEPFEIDRSVYSNMDDWLPIGNIETVRK